VTDLEHDAEFPFSEALIRMREGGNVRRKGWASTVRLDSDGEIVWADLSAIERPLAEVGLGFILTHKKANLRDTDLLATDWSEVKP